MLKRFGNKFYKKRGTVDDVFATTKGPPRTPPTKDELDSVKNPNTVGIGRLRRDLNKQHETLLQQLAEQKGDNYISAESIERIL